MCLLCQAILHGCTIEDDTLIGMGAILMDGAVIGKGSVVGAGALVLQNFRCPPNSLVVGSPAKIKKQYSGESLERMRAMIAHSHEMYTRNAKSFKETMKTSNSDSGSGWSVSSVQGPLYAIWLSAICAERVVWCLERVV